MSSSVWNSARHCQVLRKTGEVGLVAKAWNGRCVLRWLSHCLQDALVSNGDNDCLVLTTAATTLVWIYWPQLTLSWGVWGPHYHYTQMVLFLLEKIRLKFSTTTLVWNKMTKNIWFLVAWDEMFMALAPISFPVFCSSRSSLAHFFSLMESSPRVLMHGLTEKALLDVELITVFINW